MFLGNKKCRIYAACSVSQTPKSYKIRKDTIYEIKTHFGADGCCYPNHPLRLFHHLRPDGQSTGRKSAAGIAVLHDRDTGGALWVCGGTAIF